jgi:hypothetical protein
MEIGAICDTKYDVQAAVARNRCAIFRFSCQLTYASSNNQDCVGCVTATESTKCEWTWLGAARDIYDIRQSA